jgi:hypothetical protein
VGEDVRIDVSEAVGLRFRARHLAGPRMSLLLPMVFCVSLLS